MTRTPRDEDVLALGERLDLGLIVAFGFEQRRDDRGGALGLAARLEQGFGNRLLALERLQRVAETGRDAFNGNSSGFGRSTLTCLAADG